MDKSRHHIYFIHEYNGNKTGVATFISHSKKLKDISGSLLNSIKSQLMLNSIKDTVDFLNCPMDEKAYNKILFEKGFLEKL